MDEAYAIALLENETYCLLWCDHIQPIKHPEFNEVTLYEI